MSPGEMITGSAVAAVVSDPNLPDTPIVACNQAFIDLTGYAEHEILGRNCRFLRGPDTEEAATEELRAAVRERRATLVEVLNYKKDGTPFRNAVMLAPIFAEDGSLQYMLGSQIEVGTRPDSDAAARIAALTPRQRDVLDGVMRGLLNKQIAYELGISERTVKLHRAEMLQALGCRTVAEAIRLAVEHGL
ncbi:histidine kinase [Sphingomonas sp. Leaf11]|nr:histidine kinase [Sphingomonas sp. Leaf9]KQM41977.1 histidine kinase [Sphingomonas sp. Leaf11]